MSGEFEADGVGAPIILGATGMEEILQNINIILRTSAWSLPMDRAFAGEVPYLDSPLPHAAAARMAELVDRVERHEPRVRVHRIYFRPDPEAAMDGRATPVVAFSLKDGVMV